MGISRYINVPVFIVALLLGLCAVYFTMPDTRKIYVYPTPENVELLQYRDKSQNCFSLQQTEVKCPFNDMGVTKIPVQ